ncbi:hypothetical protein Mgra_00007124 [Meloidogyne graminicola]|uniref:Regulatory protein zeste n=1 Tax=Meloidogyne graminicola TaxID=189291 RepID=A0A8S9ZJG0_9BILA|nr:hypothetical protein Mgra_00007124 [Meloidogyne graminicola]
MLFTKIMKFRILELVNENYEEIHPTTRSAEANKRSNAAWERITTSMNNEFPNNIVTTKQIKECFKYLKKISKEQILRNNYFNEQNIKEDIKEELIDENSSESKSPVPNNSFNAMLGSFLCGLPGVISSINDDNSEIFETFRINDSSTLKKWFSPTNVEVNEESINLNSKKRSNDLTNSQTNSSKKPKIISCDNDQTNILQLKKSLLEAELELTKKRTEAI